MAARDPSPAEIAMLMGGWPEPWAHWFGGEYPSRTSSWPPQRGWECPGCRRCYGPHIAMCTYCGGKNTAAPAGEPALTVGVSRRLSPDDEMSDEDYER